MIDICICGGSAKETYELRSFIECFAAEHSEFAPRLREFYSPLELLRYTEINGGFDIYFLDVIMPEMSGIKFAERIRERGEKSEIVFLADSREYALDAFSVRAFSYLIKPVSRERLLSELNECLNRIEATRPKPLIKTSRGIVTLPLSEIIAVEYFDHRLIYHLINGEKIESMYHKQPFDVQTEKLAQTGAFLKISASYLINSQNVREIKSNEFIMRDGSRYKITRSYAGAKQKYINGLALCH